MVQHLHAQVFEEIELLLAGWQKTHIQVCRIYVYVGFGRIKRHQGLGDIIHGIGVLELVAEDNHPVRKGFLIVDILPPSVEEFERIARTDCCGGRDDE